MWRVKTAGEEGKLLLLHLTFLGWVSKASPTALCCFRDCTVLALDNDCLVACGEEISVGQSVILRAESVSGGLMTGRRSAQETEMIAGSHYSR